MIAYPIGDPIGSHRVRPNRPRIAHIVSCRFGPYEPCVSHSLFSSDSPQPALLPGKHNAAMRQAATGVRS